MLNVEKFVEEFNGANFKKYLKASKMPRKLKRYLKKQYKENGVGKNSKFNILFIYNDPDTETARGVIYTKSEEGKTLETMLKFYQKADKEYREPLCRKLI
jgi:hypothetical protein